MSNPPVAAAHRPAPGPSSIESLILKPGDVLVIPGGSESVIAEAVPLKPQSHRIDFIADSKGNTPESLVVRGYKPDWTPGVIGGFTVKRGDAITGTLIGDRVVGAIERVRPGRYRLRLDQKHAQHIWVEILSAEARERLEDQGRQQSRRREEM